MQIFNLKTQMKITIKRGFKFINQIINGMKIIDKIDMKQKLKQLLQNLKK